MDAEGSPRSGANPRVDLACLDALGERKQHDSERDQRHDHDEREEQPKTTPEAHAARTPTHRLSLRLGLFGALQRRYHESATGL